MSIKKLFVGFAVVAVALGVAVAPASAQTAAELQAMIAQLQAQIAQLMGQTAAPSVTAAPIAPLTIGSSGVQVTALQNFLVGKGFSIPAGATGYFGAQTQSALAAYQAARGISPAAGYYGPITQASVAGELTPVVPPTTPTTPTTPGPKLEGGEGTLDRVSSLGDIETVLDEGERDVKVVGVEFRAKDSDMAIQRMDVDFDLSGSSGSTRLDRYIRSASIELDGEVLATMNASQASRSGSLSTMRFTGLNGVVREGRTGQLYVVVDAVTSIGANEDGEDVTVIIPQNGVRVVDAVGISDTYFSSDYEQTFSVNVATSGRLTISEGSSNPTDKQVKGDSNSVTTGVTLLEFNLRARDAGVEIFDLPVSLGTTGGPNVSEVVQNVKLMRGSTTLRSQTVSGAATYAVVTFRDINREINSGSTETYRVVADIKRMTGNFGANDTLVASTTHSLAGWSIEDEQGNSVSSSNGLTGSAVGGVVTFQEEGIGVELVSATDIKPTVHNDVDRGTFVIAFRVTADDDDLYIRKGTPVRNAAGTTATAVNWATTTSSDVGATDIGAPSLTASGSTTNDNATYFKVNAGSSRTFTLTVVLNGTATGGFAGVRLTGVAYSLTSTAGDDSVYTVGLDDFKVNDIFLKDNS